MSDLPKTSTNCLIGCWLVAAAFGFSIYVTGLVFFGESNAIPFGLATFISLGLIISYLYCYMPRNAKAKELAIEAAARAKAEAEQARVARGAEPDFDWDSSEDDSDDDDMQDETASMDNDADGPEALPLDDEALRDDAPLDDAHVDEDDSAQSTGQPVGYDGPEGEADDLKQIKGIGPKLEQILNDMGIFHIAQIAEWGARETAWLDENLDGFKGRATRDDWVSQAKALIQTQEGDDDETL
ncbi:MAG: hypothetical protein ABF310_06665 [Paracoccaceae bacterium]